MIKFLQHIFVINLVCSIVACSSVKTFENQDKNTKQIIVSRGDTLIKAQILIVPPDIKLNNSLEYYWYYSDAIRSNIGGYTGNLLHGQYVAINHSKKLLIKGYFKNGLKTGDWKIWYPNGALHYSEKWENGLLNGEYEIYSKNNSLEKTENYKNGKLHGEIIEFLSDTVIKRKYKDGVEILIQEEEENIAKSKIFSRKEKRNQDKEFKDEMPENGDDKKPKTNFFKSFFNSKADSIADDKIKSTDTNENNVLKKQK